MISRQSLAHLPSHFIPLRRTTRHPHHLHFLTQPAFLIRPSVYPKTVAPCLTLYTPYSKVLYKIPPKLEDADFPSDMDAKSAFHTYPGVPLLTGSPFSSTPVERHMSLSGCLHCTPGQYYPSHCELHFHLRSWMPEHLRFCKAPCNRFTSSRARRVKLEFLELTGYTESQIKAGSSVLLDSVPTLHGGHYAVPKNCSVIGRHTDPAEGFCGTCGVSYRKQYENGRMRLSPYTEDGVKMPQYYNWRTMMNK